MYVADDNRSPFDVRRTLPPHTDPNIEDPEFAEYLYQQINVMVFLLGDIKLGTLYGDMKAWFPDLLARAQNEWPSQHPDFPTDLQTLVLQEGGEIQAQLDTIRGAVPFRPFWEQSVTSSVDPRRKIVEAFRRLSTHTTYGHCFCLPFLKFQSTEEPQSPRRVPQATMVKHIQDTKDETLLDLYSKPRKSFADLAAAIRRGIDAGILSEAGPGIGHIKGGGGNNNRICDAGLSTCISRENHWCNTDANGFCTVAGG